MTFWIFHTNDFHGRLTDAGADAIRAARAPYPGSLLLDAGDAVSAGNLGFRPSGEPILARMSDAGYDAMTVGNRESHPRRELFPRKLAEARFPILCANVTARPGAELPTKPYVVLEAGESDGVTGRARVAVMGLSVPMFTRKMWTQALCDYFYGDPLATARALVPALREQADVVVALTHIGLQHDERLASSVAGIDLIVGGHTHADLETPRIVSGIPILHTSAYAAYLGRACLEVLPEGGARLLQWSRLPLREQ